MRTLQLLPLFTMCILPSGCNRNQDTSQQLDSPISRRIAPVQLTDANFQREVLENDRPVLVDMWAPWCQTCLDMKPAIRLLAEEFAGQVTVAELDVSNHPFITQKYDIDHYPMLLIFVDGVEVQRIVGQQSRVELSETLQEIVRVMPKHRGIP